MSDRAVVLLSGGLDSTTCLAIAAKTYEVHAVSFDYSQRHRQELRAAKLIADHYQIASHRIFNLPNVGGSALTDSSVAVPHGRAIDSSIPVTYVPARNTVFLAFALAYAEVVEADRIFIGVNALDYSGYPDCRPEFIDAFEQMANLATKRTVEGDGLEIATPLIDMSKEAIVAQGLRLGVPFELTWSCYDPKLVGQATFGEYAACGECDSCQLRLAAFQANHIPDPAPYAIDLSSR